MKNLQTLALALLAGGFAWLASRKVKADDDFDYLEEDDGDLTLDDDEDTGPKQADIVLPPPAIEPIPAVPQIPTVPTNPPNHSGNPAGYDTMLFPNSFEVRKVLNGLGYAMPVVNAPPASSKVQQFQSDYNASAAGNFLGLTGSLVVDGIPGKHTLNALRFAAFGPNGPDPSDVVRWTQWRNENDLWG